MNRLNTFLAAIFLCFSAKAQHLPVIAIENVRTGRTVLFPKVCKKGRVTLVCFWGTWCAHGKHQLNDIANESRKWSQLYNVDVVAIATEETTMMQKIVPYIRAKKWNFDCYLDSYSKLKMAFGATALPYMLIIDTNGKIQFTHTAYVLIPALETELRLLSRK